MLGPLLFLLYINDLPDYLQHGSNVNLFADDSILYRTVNSKEDAEKLQNDLRCLQKWENDWMMSFHPSKCQTMHITNKRRPLESVYTIHGQTLEKVDSTKYLGINLHKTLSWKTHVDVISKRANNMCSFLSRNLHKCSKDTKEAAYRSLVRPLVEYASPVWDPHTKADTDKLERVQRRAARFVCGDYKQTNSVSAMINQLGRESLQQRRKQAKAIVMYRIVYRLVAIPTVVLIPTMSIRGNLFLIPYARTVTYQKSFFPDTIRIWNALDANTKTCTSLDQFKSEVQKTGLQGVA